MIDASAGSGSSLNLYAVATPLDALPTPEAYAWGTVTASNGRARNSITLSMTPDITPILTTSRLSPNSEQSAGVWFDLWIGWYATHASDAVIAASVFEIR